MARRRDLDTSLSRGMPQGPLYKQISEYVRRKIDRGEWGVGYQIPTEQQLCQQFGVSRITVVKALGRLVDEGLLIREQGKGTFVATPLLSHEPSELLSFTEATRRRGQTPGSIVLEKSSGVPAARMAHQLKLRPGEAVWRIKRLMLADARPVGLQTSCLPASRFPGLIDKVADNSSLYELLWEEYGLYIDTALETYSAMQLDDEEKERLQAGAAGFSVERLSFARGEPVEFVKSVMRSDSTHYTVLLSRKGAWRGR